jgi:hypothetical protein
VGGGCDGVGGVCDGVGGCVVGVGVMVLGGGGVMGVLGGGDLVVMTRDDSGGWGLALDWNKLMCGNIISLTCAPRLA